MTGKSAAAFVDALTAQHEAMWHRAEERYWRCYFRPSVAIRCESERVGGVMDIGFQRYECIACPTRGFGSRGALNAHLAKHPTMEQAARNLVAAKRETGTPIDVADLVDFAEHWWRAVE